MCEGLGFWSCGVLCGLEAWWGVFRTLGLLWFLIICVILGVKLMSVVGDPPEGGKTSDKKRNGITEKDDAMLYGLLLLFVLLALLSSRPQAFAAAEYLHTQYRNMYAHANTCVCMCVYIYIHTCTCTMYS